MAIDDTGNDPLLQMLKALGTIDVDDAHADRLRDRCCSTLLARRRMHDLAGASVNGTYQGVIEFAAVAALCGVYLEEVLRRALRLLG